MLPVAQGERRTKRDQSKADHNNVYCFLITVFRLAIPAFFSKPDNMLDHGRPWLLQLISFFKPVDARKFGYDVSVTRPSLQTLGYG